MAPLKQARGVSIQIVYLQVEGSEALWSWVTVLQLNISCVFIQCKKKEREEVRKEKRSSRNLFDV